jgi:hypothetical protein
MPKPTTDDLDGRLAAVVERAQEQVKTFQAEAEKSRLQVQERFKQFLLIADKIVVMVREKLERLKNRLKFDVIPSNVQNERFYSRAVTLDVKTELAGAVKVGFKLTHDGDVRNILLDYTLDIVPVFFKFTGHAQLEMPLESYDEAAVAKWIDDRVVDFANTYVELLSTKQYQERAMVTDPVAGISFPKYFAAATLEQDGRTSYFISDESRREYAKQHGIKL